MCKSENHQTGRDPYPLELMLLDTAERLSTEIIKRDPSIKERLLGLLSDFQTLERGEVPMHMWGDSNNTLSGWEEL